MHSNRVLLIVSFITCGLTDCNKNGTSNSVSGDGQAATLIKSYELIITDTVLANTSSDYTFTYSYDNNNRPTAATQTGTDTYKGAVTNLNFSAQFTYGQGTQTETGQLTRGGATYNTTLVYDLNSVGNPTKLVATSIVGTINTVTTNSFSYDANAYCVEEDNSSTTNNIAQPATKTLFTIAGGNVVGENTYWATGGLISSITYSYGTTSNKTDLRFSTPPISGHPNNELVVSSNTSTQGISSSALNYTYSLDSKGRVSAAMVTTPGGKTYMQYKNIQYIN
ncbi:MAG TPA: hypothetical protein VMT76_17030 [Puia sp.]|nr:hypothetical protein [Puia sp.]